MKTAICLLILVSFWGCQDEGVRPADAESDSATTLSGAYKVTAAYILNSSSPLTKTPDDSLFISKISPNVVKVTYRIKSSIKDSPDVEYLTIEKKDTNYYWFLLTKSYVRMSYRYERIELILADGYYKLHFTKLKM